MARITPRRIAPFAVVLWLLCGVPSYGMWLAYFQAQWDSPQQAAKHCREDAGAGALTILGGPITTTVYFFLEGFAEHGFKWRCP